MPHVTALRNCVLCGFAVVAIAGCGAASRTRNTSTVPAVPGTGAPTGAPMTSPVATPPSGPDMTGINQQINTINAQLSTINGQLNAAGSGLSTSEGDPSQ